MEFFLGFHGGRTFPTSLITKDMVPASTTILMRCVYRVSWHQPPPVGAMRQLGKGYYKKGAEEDSLLCVLYGLYTSLFFVFFVS